MRIVLAASAFNAHTLSDMTPMLKRRICPGRHFAESSLFLTATSVLHTLSVTPPLDTAGRPQRPKVKMTAGFVSCVPCSCRLESVNLTDGHYRYPEPFKCVIKPRAPWAEALIRANDQVAT